MLFKKYGWTLNKVSYSLTLNEHLHQYNIHMAFQLGWIQIQSSYFASNRRVWKK